MPTIQQQINQLKKDKESLNTMLNTMGVETTGNETFTQLTPLVGKIVTDPILQDKIVEITENGTTNIVADEGYDGLYNVSVNTNVASSGAEINVFIQEEEPEKKNGIWLKKENNGVNNISFTNATIGEKWEKLQEPTPIVASYQRVVKYGNCLYVFGGRLSSGEFTNKAYKYNLTDKTFSNLADMPIALASGAIGIVGTNIYLLCGFTTNGYSSDIYKYDILSDSYTKIGNLPQAFAHCMWGTVGTDIYVLGGTTDGGYAGTLNTVYKFDTLTETYEEMAKLPNECRTGSATVVGTDIYMFSGNEKTSPIKNVVKYDTLTNSHTTLAALPKNHTHLATGVIGDDIYLIGGFLNSAGTTFVYKYSISSDTFTSLTSTPHAIYNTGYCNDGTSVYLVGGQTAGGYLDDIVKYNISGDVSYEEDTLVITTNENLYSAKISNNLSVSFNDVYIYNAEENGFINSTAYYGDGSKWTKFKN